MSAPEPGARGDSIRHLVVLGHPDPDSFCASVARRYCETVEGFGQAAVLRDLYRLGFDPALRLEEIPHPGAPLRPAEDIAGEIDLLGAADAIVLVYPIWFGMPPAIIKGYVDRVLGAGFTARDIKQGRRHPLLQGKRLISFSTSASTRPWLEEKGQWTALSHGFDTYLQTIFALRDGGHTHFDAIVPGLKERFVRENLAQVAEAATQRAAELFEEHRKAKIASDRARAFAHFESAG